MTAHPSHQHPTGRAHHGAGRDHDHDHHGHDGHDAGLAELLDLDAEVLGSYLDEVTGWVARWAPAVPGTVVDLGTGSGTGTVALGRRFPQARLVAIDRSAPMLERVRSAASTHRLTERLTLVEADVDDRWPDALEADLVWAASLLHEIAEPHRLLEDVRQALRPGGVLAVVEMDTLPRFLPNDLGIGRASLESRCHEALAQLGWNEHPDWRIHLERAGFEITAQHTFTIAGDPRGTARYARAYLRRIRPALHESLAADDLDTLDRLLADDGPDSLLHRTDLAARGSRTAWAVRRA